MNEINDSSFVEASTIRWSNKFSNQWVLLCVQFVFTTLKCLWNEFFYYLEPNFSVELLQISLKSVGLTVLRSTEIFLLSHHLSNIFIPHSVAFLVFFLLEPFAQFHPVARCLSPTFGWKNADLPFSNSTRTTKWAITNWCQLWHWNGILRDPEVLIGQAKLFDISAANQNQGAKCICSPRISRLARNKARFTESSLSFRRAYWYNINLTVPKIKERMTYCPNNAY